MFPTNCFDGRCDHYEGDCLSIKLMFRKEAEDTRHDDNGGKSLRRIERGIMRSFLYYLISSNQPDGV